MENMINQKLSELISLLNEFVKEDVSSASLETLKSRQAMIKQSQKLTFEFSKSLNKEFNRNNQERIRKLKQPGPSKLSNRQLAELVQEQAKLIAKLQLSKEGDPPKESQ
jgi:poly-D-alanine transfer protein DltD